MESREICLNVHVELKYSLFLGPGLFPFDYMMPLKPGPTELRTGTCYFQKGIHTSTYRKATPEEQSDMDFVA